MKRRLFERRVNWGALPDDLISNILIKLPCEYLWDVCRFVCKDWLKMIRDPLFMNSSISDPSFIILKFSKRIPSVARLLSDPSSSPKFELLDLQFQYRGMAVAGCDGILLFNLRGDLYVTNPLTGQRFYLPSPTAEQNVKLKCCLSTITRVPETGKFKVVCLGREGLNKERFSWFVLTIGTNMSWTKIPGITEKWQWAHLIGVGGVVYGYRYHVYTYDCTPPNSQIIRVNWQTFRAIDLRGDDPRTCKLRPPALKKLKPKAGCWLVDMGRSHLGFVNAVKDEADIWMLKDLYRQKWMKVKSIKFRNPPYMISPWFIKSFILLEGGEIWIISPAHYQETETVAYFASTGTWQTIYRGEKPVLVFQVIICKWDQQDEQVMKVPKDEVCNSTLF